MACLALPLAACGADTLTASAVNAGAAAQEAKAAAEQEARVKQQLKTAQDAEAQHVRDIDRQTDAGAH